MPPYDEYSDSDESDAEELQTSVLLGLPDGPIHFSADLARPRVSRIGGLPVYPSGIPKPSLSASRCDSCRQPMELLLQLWCPLESSAYDRTLHIWGCSRTSCQRKDGSVKSIRALRFNAKYAAKMEAKRLKQATIMKTPKTPTANPFSTTGGTNGPQLFGGGFGDDDEESSKEASSSGDPSSASEEDDDDDDDDEVKPKDEKLSPSADVSALASALEQSQISDEDKSDAVTTSPILDAVPAHPPLYLDTVFEYITPVSTNDATAQAVKKAGQQDGSGGETQWGVEGYEKMQGLDEVFERFVSRVENEPHQCVRYDLAGTPLPFATEAVYKRLFPLEHTLTPSPGTPVVVTGGKEGSGAVLNPDNGRRIYDPRSIPPCEACGSSRAFECQLMPNLINVLRQARRTPGKDSGKQPVKKQTDEERRAEVARLLRGEAASPKDDIGDMEWGTCLVFSCIKDCCRAKGADGTWSDAESAWKDEFVLVQWDV